MEIDPTLVDVSPATLSNDALVAIARIVRACAYLEDALNLWICKLAGSHEAATSTLLGRSPISTKKSIASALAKMTDERTYELHKAAFESTFDNMLQCRNAVAHGVLMGQTDKGYAFSSNISTDIEAANLWHRASVYSAATMIAIADNAEFRLRAMDDFLGLTSLRDRRQWRRLPEIHRDQPKPQSSSKRKRPPQPSDR